MTASSWLVAFCAAFLAAGGWVISVDSVRTQPALQNAMTAVFLYAMSAFATIAYTEHRWLLLPSALGDGAGAFAAIGWLRRRDA